MSSAILYLAIVAIWACVLIPRWLRRGAATPAGAETAVPGTYPADGLEDDTFADDETDEDAPLTSAVPAPPRSWRGSRASAASPAEPLSPEESRRHMLAARRRLLLMLLGLEIAATALAVLGLAAVWVVVPPTVMLAGYLLLLREAAQADAEQARFAADTAAAERARADRAVRAVWAKTPADRDTPADGTVTDGIPAAAAELAARFAAAPVPGDYEDAGPGRDFAPGLAGKYTTSNADAEADDDYYGYERLRAVGD